MGLCGSGVKEYMYQAKKHVNMWCAAENTYSVTVVNGEIPECSNCCSNGVTWGILEKRQQDHQAAGSDHPHLVLLLWSKEHIQGQWLYKIRSAPKHSQFTSNTDCSCYRVNKSVNNGGGGRWYTCMTNAVSRCDHSLPLLRCSPTAILLIMKLRTLKLIALQRIVNFHLLLFLTEYRPIWPEPSQSHHQLQVVGCQIPFYMTMCFEHTYVRIYHNWNSPSSVCTYISTYVPSEAKFLNAKHAWHRTWDGKMIIQSKAPLHNTVQ